MHEMLVQYALNVYHKVFASDAHSIDSLLKPLELSNLCNLPGFGTIDGYRLPTRPALRGAVRAVMSKKKK